MTDKEILENSKHIIDIKKDIDSGEKAAPDLENQVRERFLDDCVNRARFVDSSLIISAIAKEFRNVFGVEVPNFKISSKCKLQYDRNENGKFDVGEAIEIKDDPMKNGASGYYYELDDDDDDDESVKFVDSWEAINAARFDCPFDTTNFEGDWKTLPVEKQNFFIDSKKDEKSSTFHSPVCPPGYDRWAGNKVYENICKNFDLDEITLYKILSSLKSVPKEFTLAFDKRRPFRTSIDPKGELVGDKFSYSLKKDDKGEVKESESILRNEISRSGAGTCSIPQEICVAEVDNPTTWYTWKIPVNSKHVDQYYVKQYIYTYNFKGTPFEYTKTPIVSFTLKYDKRRLNSGYAILCADPMQELPGSGETDISSIDYRYTINVIYLDDEDEDGIIYNYPYRIIDSIVPRFTGTFSPITTISKDCQKQLARFIMSLIKDCFNYHDMITERGINNIIPDYSASLNKMDYLRQKITRFINGGYHDSTSWDRVLDALWERVLYDITGKSDPTSAEINKIKNSTRLHEVSLQYTGITDKYAFDYYNIGLIRGWQYLDGLKAMSDPININRKIINIVSTTTNKKFEYSLIEKRVTNSQFFLVLIDSGRMSTTGKVTIEDNTTTLQYLVDNVLTEEDKDYLISKDLLRYQNVAVEGEDYPVRKYTRIKIPGINVYGGTDWCQINDTEHYEIIYNHYDETRPTYNEIKRASDLNWFMLNNPEMFTNSFNTITSRIDKRTGTLRETFNILDSANINIQMLEQKKNELRNLFRYMNAYEITEGFGTNEITIQLTAWEGENIGSVYSVLERMGTVYILSDLTTLKTYSGSSLSNIIKIDSSVRTLVDRISIEMFSKNYVKTSIKEIIEQISDTQYEYTKTEDATVKRNKTYYVLNDKGEYIVAKTSSELSDDNIGNLYERSSAISGPTFRVTLQKPIPINFEGRNARLVKVY